MNVSVQSRDPVRSTADTLAVAVVQREAGDSKLPRRLAPLDRSLGGVIAAVLRSGDFHGRADEVLALYPTESSKVQRVLLVGLGNEKDISIEKLRRTAGATVSRARAKGAKTVALLMPKLRRLKLERSAPALAEGAVLADYRFDTYQQKRDNGHKNLRAFQLLYDTSAGLQAARRAVRDATAIAESQNIARQLSNEPANHLPPAALAREAQKVARKTGLKSRVFGVAELRKMGMGGILAVGQGSTNTPRLIVLEHRGKTTGRAKAPAPAMCIVGKGITFDSGGISIKPSAGMQDMKHDMSGAAAVVGIMSAVARLDLPQRVVGILAAAENMPSATAYRPGDVITTYSGKTIEVLNTDAEGRIVLADALHYAEKHYGPQSIVDLATLTGAMMIALGGAATGVFGNNDKLIGAIRESGDTTGEIAWPMPLFDEHRKAMKSTIADLRNTGGRSGGASTAAAFLAEFVSSDTPWLHLDIAGTGWTDSPGPYQPRGATGVGVRLLVDLLRRWDAGEMV